MTRQPPSRRGGSAHQREGTPFQQTRGTPLRRNGVIRSKCNLRSFWVWLWNNSEPWNSLPKEAAEGASLGMFTRGWAERDEVPSGSNPGNAPGTPVCQLRSCLVSLSLLVGYLLIYLQHSHNLRLPNTIILMPFICSEGPLHPARELSASQRHQFCSRCQGKDCSSPR